MELSGQFFLAESVRLVVVIHLEATKINFILGTIDLLFNFKTCPTKVNKDVASMLPLNVLQ